MTKTFPLDERVRRLIASEIGQSQDLRLGAFGFSSGLNSIEWTFFSVGILSMLGQLGILPSPTGIADFVIRCQNPDGGFGDSPAQPSNCYSTHLAIAVLRLIDRTEAINVASAIAWLSSCQAPDGPFQCVIAASPDYVPEPSTWASYHCISALTLLFPLATQPINLETAHDYASSLVSAVETYGSRTAWPNHSGDLCKSSACSEFFAIGLLRLLDVPLSTPHLDAITNALLTFLQKIDDRNDFTDAHFYNTYEVFFHVAAIDLLVGAHHISQKVVYPNGEMPLDKYVKGLITVNASDGTDSTYGPYTAGIAALQYSGQKEYGGDIHARSTFYGLATLCLIEGSRFHAALGMPFDGELPESPTMKDSGNEYYSCFVSYASADAGFVAKLRADLEAHGIGHYYAPKEMRIGAELHADLMREVTRNDRFLLILSNNAVHSAWVEKEVQCALLEEQRRGKSIIVPLTIDGWPLSSDREWVDRIAQRFVLDMNDGNVREAYLNGFDKLLRSLRR